MYFRPTVYELLQELIKTQMRDKEREVRGKWILNHIITNGRGGDENEDSCLPKLNGSLNIMQRNQALKSALERKQKHHTSTSISVWLANRKWLINRLVYWTRCYWEKEKKKRKSIHYQIATMTQFILVNQKQ